MICRLMRLDVAVGVNNSRATVTEDPGLGRNDVQGYNKMPKCAKWGGGGSGPQFLNIYT